jgi:kinesin family member 6/9
LGLEQVHVSYLEIYNEAAYDLLHPQRGGTGLEDLPHVTVLEDAQGNCHARGLSMHRADSEEEALNLVPRISCHEQV